MKELFEFWAAHPWMVWGVVATIFVAPYVVGKR